MPTSTEPRSSASPANRPHRLAAFGIAGLTLFLASSALRAADAEESEPGIDLAGIDRSVAPDDFFAYANGTWLKTTEIPADRAAWGSFAVLAEEANRRTQELIQEAAAAGASGATAADARKVGDFYLAFMDEAAIEAKGKTPIEPSSPPSPRSPTRRPSRVSSAPSCAPTSIRST